MTEENIEIGTGDSAELANAHEAAHEAAVVRERERDDRLDADVRRAAALAFGQGGATKPSHDAPQSMEQTIAETYLAIQNRPEPLTMPPLPLVAGKPPSIEETLAAQEQWGRMTPSDQRMHSDAYKQVESMKAAAEAFGIKVETASDLQALRQLTGQQQQQASTAPSEVWSKIGIGHEVRSDREAFERMDGFVQRWGPTFQRAGLTVAEGIEHLAAAQEMFNRDPQGFVNQLAQQAGLVPQAIPSQEGQERQAAQITLHEWMQTKQNVTPELRIEMANIIQEPGFKADGSSLTLLEAAYREAKRRAGVRAKRAPGKKLEDSVDRAAREVYRR